MIRKLAIAAGAVMITAGLLPLTATSASAVTGASMGRDAARATPVNMLGSIPVVQRYLAGWHKSNFPTVNSKVKGCTVRQRAMATASLSGKLRGCSMVGGSWKLDYTKLRTSKRTAPAVAMMIPPVEAWRAGAWNWTAAQRSAFVKDTKDVRVHLVTSKKLIKQRNNRKPNQWMPKGAAAKCAYAIDWVAVKYKYNLAMDEPEYAALNKVLADPGCTKARQNIAGVKPIATIPTQDVAPSTELIGRVIGPEMFGMNVKPVSSMPTVPFGTMRLWDGYGWANIEPARDTFNWKRLDDAVAAGAKANARVMLTLALTPEWAATTPGATVYETGASPPKDVNDWYDYVDKVSKRYAGRIAAYQVWNEANLNTFWRGSVDQMADMTKRAYEIIKANDPNAIVVAPSTTIRLTEAFGDFYPKFLAALKARGWPLDVLSVHSYPPSTGKSKERDAGLALLRVIMRNADVKNTPVWETEINFGLAGPGTKYPDVDYTPEEQQTLLVRAYLDSLRNALATTVWFEWQESENDLLGVQMYPGTAPTVTWNAMTSALIGSTYNGCSDNPGTNTATTVTCNFTDASGPFTVMWSTDGAQPATIGGGQTACRFGGACQNGPQITLTDAPVLVR